MGQWGFSVHGLCNRTDEQGGFVDCSGIGILYTEEMDAALVTFMQLAHIVSLRTVAEVLTKVPTHA